MKTVEWENLPKCDFCGSDAEYDAPTKQGPWAYMCEQHYRIYGRGGDLGTHIVKKTLKVVVPPEKMKSVQVPMDEDSMDVAEVHCPYCGTSRSVEPDANYVVTCEGCGHKYRVYSLI